MQFLSIIAIIALAATGAVAHPPPKPTPPTRPPPPPVVSQTISCNGGSPYCCSPTGNGDATCIVAVTQCNTILICCGDTAEGGSQVSACVGTATAIATATATAIVSAGSILAIITSPAGPSATTNANIANGSSTSRSRIVPPMFSVAQSQSVRAKVPSWSLGLLLFLVG